MTQTNPSSPAAPQPLVSRGAAPLSGTLRVPGDRLTAQFGLMLAALAVGCSSLEGLTATPDLLASAETLRRLGVTITIEGQVWHINGLGTGGLLQPEAPLVPGSAEGSALLLGLLAPYPFTTQMVGPFAQAEPALRAALAPIAQIEKDSDGLSLRGSPLPLPLHHTLAAPDAVTRMALLLAAAQTRGISTLIESHAGPDHAEKLLAGFGARLETHQDEAGAGTLALTGLAELSPQRLAIAGDPALAAYPAVAALIVPGSELTIENVLINPARTGLIDTLLEMGGDIMFLNQREMAGEHVADLRVRSSRMKGITLSSDHGAAMARDLALLAVAAAYAEGETLFAGEWDARGAALAAALGASKVSATITTDGLRIAGTGKVEGGGRPVATPDPRIAMSLMVLGLASRKRVALEDAGGIDDLFPGFIQTLKGAGARIEPRKGRAS